MPTAPARIHPEIRMYSINAASEKSDLARSTLYNFIKSGRLKTVKVGGRRLIPDEALRRLLKIEEVGDA
jgi:excisionase family DNA binding protein